MCALVTLAANYALALVDFDAPSLELTLSQLTYRLLVSAAAIACVIRAIRVPADRLGWALIGSGLGAWAAGDVYYWLALSGSPDIPYPSLSDGLFFAFYAATLIGLRLLASGGQWSIITLLDLCLGLLGLATLWAWLVFAPVIEPGGNMAAVATTLTYPLLDLALLASVLIALGTNSWQADRRLSALAAGIAIIAVADSVYAAQVAEGSYVDGGVLDSLWPTGAVLIAAAAWLRVRTPRPSRLNRDELSLWLAVGAVAVALVVIVWDRFEHLKLPAFELAVITLAAATVQLIVLHRQRARALVRAETAATLSAHALAAVVDIRDHVTSKASNRIAGLTAALGAAFGLPASRTERLGLAARLHDVGKIAVDDAILRKPGPLSQRESELVKRHAEHGAELLDAIGFNDIATWIRHHHERWDGSGYPAGLARKEIPLESRILGAVDAYAAMTSHLPDRRSLSLAEVKRAFEDGAGSEFDPAVVSALMEVVRSDPAFRDRTPGPDEQNLKPLETDPPGAERNHV